MVYRLFANALQHMRVWDPEVAAILHEWIAPSRR
jgi:hypothetical protein